MAQLGAAVRRIRTGALRQTRGDRIFDLMTTVLLAVVFITVAYPLYFVVIASVSDPTEIYLGHTLLAPKGVTLVGYKRILAETRIWTGYRNTVIYTLFGTLFSLLLTIPAGYALSRNDMPGRGIMLKFMVFTMFFSGGLIPTYFVVKGLGLVNKPVVMVVLGALAVNHVFIARTFFKSNIPQEMLEAALIDGCNNTRFFISIVLPLSKAIIAVIALYVGVGHWNNYFTGLIYLNKQKYYPLQLILRDLLLSSSAVAQDTNITAEEASEMQRVAESIKYGIIIVASVPVLAVYPFLQRYFVKGVMIGSVKG